MDRHKAAVSDIVIFGSSMRGKKNAADLDVLLLFRTAIDKDVEHELRSILTKLQNEVSIISKTEETFKNPDFDAREGILFEGYSMASNRFIAQGFGFTSMGLFIYDTGSLKNPEKTRFYYALNGRGSNKGILQMCDGIKVLDNLVAFPLMSIEEVKDFFEMWKLEYKYIPSVIPQRLAKQKFFGKEVQREV